MNKVLEVVCPCWGTFHFFQTVFQDVKHFFHLFHEMLILVQLEII